MIPVAPQPEPEGFERKVRQRGLDWIASQGLDLSQPTPPGLEFQPYWRECLPDLHRLYGGVCAYLCVFFEWETGGATVDHFVSKSRSQLRLAYEWSNYRLACPRLNSRKLNFEDVLDPFELQLGMFRLELVTGHVFPNPDVDEAEKDRIRATIMRLDLDNANCREMRVRHFRHFSLGQWSEAVLREYSPFVWAEARRQELL